MNYAIRYLFFFLVSSLLSGAVVAQSLQEPIVQAAVVYHSDYVSEGRSNLQQGGLGEVVLGLQTGILVLEAIQMDATRQSYSETILLAGLALSAGSFDTLVSLARILSREQGDTEGETELAVELVHTGLDVLVPFASYIYSDSASATWLELGLTTAFNLGDLELAPYVLSGWNQGYVAGESKGINHLQLGVDLLLPITDRIEFNGYLAHSRALNREPTDSTENLIWGGVGLTFSF